MHGTLRGLRHFPRPVPRPVVHADRGTSMTSKTVATLLADLVVTRSHSRPRVSNDNPYSESLFKTLKYGPEFLERFGSRREARQFMELFAHWIQPRAPSHWHRTAHARRRALRVGHRQSRRAALGAHRRPGPAPAPLRHDPRAEDPRPTRHRINQPAANTTQEALTTPV